MTENIFYLHEDEWAMINVMPAENLSRTKEITKDAQDFGEAHFDGRGWTEIYLIPEVISNFQEVRKWDFYSVLLQPSSTSADELKT